jgi:hypothetical protein
MAVALCAANHQTRADFRAERFAFCCPMQPRIAAYARRQKICSRVVWMAGETCFVPTAAV